MAQRVRLHKTSGWNRVEIEDFDCPRPGANQVKVDVRAAGVNMVDSRLNKGFYALGEQRVGWPITPGFEVSGFVMEVGENVVDFQVGDRVFGFTFFEGYGTQVLLDTTFVRHIPEGMSFGEAASATVAFGLAFHIVHNLITPKKKTAVVYSAVDDVGLATLQLLKDAGYAVLAVVYDPEQMELAQRYGADVVTHRGSADIETHRKQIAPKGFDLICDPRGMFPLDQHYKHLARKGQVISFAQQQPIIDPLTGQRHDFATLAVRYNKPPKWFSWFRKQKPPLFIDASGLFEQRNVITTYLEYVVPKFESRTLYVSPMTKLDFHQVARAFALVQAPNATGKLILIFE